MITARMRREEGGSCGPQRGEMEARVTKARKLTLHFWHDYSENEEGGRG